MQKSWGSINLWAKPDRVLEIMLRQGAVLQLNVRCVHTTISFIECYKTTFARTCVRSGLKTNMPLWKILCNIWFLERTSWSAPDQEKENILATISKAASLMEKAKNLWRCTVTPMGQRLHRCTVQTAPRNPHSWWWFHILHIDNVQPQEGRPTNTKASHTLQISCSTVASASHLRMADWHVVY